MTTSFPTLSRRRILGGALATASLGQPFLQLHAQAWRGRDPFTLGVASGCPRPDGMVLWTRLAPDPLQPTGGMDDAPVDVAWELAEDERFLRIVQRGTVRATAELAHSVRVELQGLAPARFYWYRFTAGNARSPVGRTRTAPAEDDTATPARFAFASCQQFEQGFYAAYRDIAAQSLDLVVHLGDYIYESSWSSRHVRKHAGGIPTDLPGFRTRHALYKTDADLQAAHAAHPWLVTWDDHEVANDYTDDVSPRSVDPDEFLAMRAAAYQAWFEHMPVPMRMRPRGPSTTIYGRYRFGQMLDVLLMDGRQYRSHHACLIKRSASPLTDCADRLAPERSFFGKAQESWLAQELQLPPTRWTVIAQQTLMAEADRKSGPEHGYWMDGWDGYAAARGRLLDALAADPRRNPLVISGDVHAFFAADLKRTPDGRPVATEFVGGSITSEGPSPSKVANLLAKNPHLRYGRGDVRGYALMSLDVRGCTVDFQAVDDVKLATSPVTRIARFTVEPGAPGVQVAST
ncbi:alkaline phosphatase D family protein [Variovorax sp. dw_954]|uniref:alkaline phosphatase D family protein n=1 Tax=Variovorax sp. dw_954 TaxID=2720078 RepID=UPI001BD3BE60|nr:alkaline phosphatase D family protein [Variovorax sp. dw_954]